MTLSIPPPTQPFSELDRTATVPWYRHFSGLTSEINSLSSAHDNLGIYNVKDYGAVGDNSTDDTTALQDAINACANAGGGTVVVPPGAYRHTGLTIPQTTGSGIRLTGVAYHVFTTAPNTGARLVFTPTSGNQITVEANWGVFIESLGLHALNTVTSGYAIAATNDATVSAHQFSHLLITNCFNGILIQGSSCALDHIFIEPSGTGDYGVRWKASTSNTHHNILWMTQVSVFCQSASASTTMDGFSIENDTLIAIDCGANLCDRGWVTVAVGGAGPVYGYLVGCVAEFSNNDGFYLDDARIYTLDRCVSTLSDNGYGLNILASSLGLQIHDSVFALNGKSGIRIQSGATETHIQNCLSYDNSLASSGTYSGLNVEANASLWSVIGGRFGGDLNLAGGTSGSQAYGIAVAAGTSDYFSIHGVNLGQNATGTLSNGGTGLNVSIVGNFPDVPTKISCSSHPTSEAVCTIGSGGAGYINLQNRGVGTAYFGVSSNDAYVSAEDAVFVRSQVSFGNSPFSTGTLEATFKNGTIFGPGTDAPGIGNIALGTGQTFASLPASPTKGMIAVVTNSSVATWGATATGGGALSVLTWYNGTNWTVIGS